MATKKKRKTKGPARAKKASSATTQTKKTARAEKRRPKTKRKTKEKSTRVAGVPSLLEALITRAKRTKRPLKQGTIVLELTGRGGGIWAVQRTTRTTKLVEGKRVQQPLVQISGSSEQMRAVMGGKLDARRAFLEGRIQVQGDVLYLEQLLVDLGLMKPGL